MKVFRVYLLSLEDARKRQNSISFRGTWKTNNQKVVIRVDTNRSLNTLESKNANTHVHTM